MKNKLNKKLTLNKDVIAKLNSSDQSKILGGASETIGTYCAGPSVFIKCITETVDVKTIGHDDGSNCLSKTDWGWCWCKGI